MEFRTKQKTKTPSKTTEQEHILKETFSPIRVTSPMPNRQGNLTGSARKLKDGAADLHNLLLKWKGLNVDGANIVTEIANIKLESILSQGEETDQPVNTLPESLLPLCEKLELTLKKMEKVSRHLSGLADMSHGVAQLEQHGAGGDAETVLFQTWDVTKFETIFREISEMYDKELQLKKCISENICHASDRNTIMFYSAAWVHEPYIDLNSKLLLESALLETGHKT